MLKFNDGVEFDTSGELRVVRRKDGYYVTGEGMLVPVEGRKEGEEVIEEILQDRADYWYDLARGQE